MNDDTILTKFGSKIGMGGGGYIIIKETTSTIRTKLRFKTSLFLVIYFLFFIN